MFGQGANMDCYLRKFVDIEYNLPESPKEEYINYLIIEKFPIIWQKIKCFGQKDKILYKGFDSWHQVPAWVFGSKNAEDINFAKENIQSILTNSKLCLREIEKCLLRLNIILIELSEEKDILEICFLLQLIIINLKKPDLFHKLNNMKNNDSIPKEDSSLIYYKYFDIISRIIKKKITNPSLNENGEYRSIYYSAEALYKYYALINLSEGIE